MWSPIEWRQDCAHRNLDAARCGFPYAYGVAHEAYEPLYREFTGLFKQQKAMYRRLNGTPSE